MSSKSTGASESWFHGLYLVLENTSIIKKTMAPIRLTRWQLFKLLAAETWRETIQGYFRPFYTAFENLTIIRTAMAPIRLTRLQLLRLLLAEIWRESGFLSRILIIGFLLISVALIFDRLFGPRSLESLGIPLAGSSDGRKMDFEGKLKATKAKYPDRPFLIRAFGVEYVVYPSKFFDEVKKLPEHQASTLAFFQDCFKEPWSGIPRQTPELIKTISVDLTRAIPSFVRSRQDDCAAATARAIGHAPEWKEMTLYSTIQQIVASTNASAFVGRQLGTDLRWIRSIERMPMTVMIASVALSCTPVLLRSMLTPILFAPTLYLRWKLKRLLGPIIEADMKEYRSASPEKRKALPGPKRQGKVQLAGWLLSRYKTEVATKKRLLDDFITLSFESTASSAGTIFFILGELCANPELADILREELTEVAPEGNLPLTHLTELKRMDSVMRESFRANPFSYLVLYRKLLAPVQLSVGPKIPAGTNICVDGHHINFSPELWGSSPEKFDGLRHYRARQEKGNEQRFKFANLGSDSPGWGDGLQACPGRLFADNTIKIVLAHLLSTYEFKLRPGEGKPVKGSLPNGTMYPDMSAKILVKSRV